MLMEKERQEIVDFGKKMSTSGLTNGTSGNISAYDATLGYMAISPSGIGYLDTTPEDIVIMDLKGNIIEGKRTPSSEHDLHTVIYKKHADVRGVVHTHSTYCTVFSCLNQPIRAVHYLIAGAESAVIPVVPYATFGTKELAENVMNTQTDGLAVLLANHGMVAYGDSLAKAFNVAENVEWLAKIQHHALAIGKPDVLSDEEITKVINKFQSYGQDNGDKVGY